MLAGDPADGEAVKRFLAVVSLALALAVSGGCGGDGETVKVTSEALVPSRHDYVVRADTICANTSQAIKTEAEARFRIDSSDFTVKPSGQVVFRPGRRPSDRRIREFGRQVVIPAFEDQLADLRALTPPEGDQAKLDSIFAAAQRGIDRLRADSSIFSDSAAVRSRLAEARRLGRRYGFFECGTYSAP
jgi:hypothetical protein